MNLRSVFFSSYGLRSGWRFGIFLAIFLTPAGFASWTVRRLTSSNTIARIAATELVSLICILAATWVMSRIERKPLSSFGLALPGSAKRFTIGVLCGFASLSALLFSMRLAGAFDFGPQVLHGASILGYAAVWALVFAMVGLFEELTTRGYALFVLSQGIGFWPAAWFLAMLFAAGHIANVGENPFGLTAAVLIAVLLAYSLKRTGSLWWAIGYHAAWDWAQSYFYGVPDSGLTFRGHLFEGIARGPSWLSGGTVGPEGSAFALLAIALLLAILLRVFKPTPPPGLERLR